MTPLHQFGEWVRQAMMQIPLSVVRVLFVAAIATLLIWVLSLPKSNVQPPDRPPSGLVDNLKLWAAVALVIQLLIYALI